MENNRSEPEQSSEGPGTTGGIARSGSAPRKKLTAKRKMTTKPIETKYEAILEVEKGVKTKAQIAREYDVPPNTLSTWMKNSASIKEGYLKFGAKRLKMRAGNFEELEAAILKWFSNTRDNNVPVSGPMIMAKAAEFAEKLGHSDFKASVGWLNRFKDRHGIAFKKICGESRSVNEESEALTEWQKNLQIILQQYKPDDIFNADETGLFFRLLPDKTMEFSHVSCHGGKQSKNRLTVLVCANMTGSEKTPLLVVGKAAKPRCFKNVKQLPTDYVSNKKAWITSEIFTNWLRKLDEKFLRQKREVVMIVDNCPAHPRVKGLKSIQLVFLPPNTTSKTQPMDQGIIKSLKDHYKKKVIHRHLQNLDNKLPLAINVLDALRFLRSSWDIVSQTTIANCFRHAEFRSDTTADADDTDPEDDIPLSRLAQLGPDYSIEDFMTADLELPTCEDVSEESIIDDVLSARTAEIASDEEASPDDIHHTETSPPVTLASCIEMSSRMRDFLEQTDDNPEMYGLISKLSDHFEKLDIKRRCAKQTLLTSFFK